MATAPELKFQKHIADFLVRVHHYGVLEQADITDTEHSIAEDLLWAFLTATQADTLKKLAADYGTDARDEVFKALRSVLAHTPLWGHVRGIKEVGCLAHARRKFFDLHVGNKSRIAQQALDYIGQLYGVEREVKHLNPDARRQIRQTQSKPLAHAMHQWMVLQRQKITDGSATAKVLWTTA